MTRERCLLTARLHAVQVRTGPREVTIGWAAVAMGVDCAAGCAVQRQPTLPLCHRTQRLAMSPTLYSQPMQHVLTLKARPLPLLRKARPLLRMPVVLCTLPVVITQASRTPTVCR